MTQGRLHGKVSIVTGGASGFGKGIAAKFVHEGSKVVIADLAGEAGQAVARELGCKFVTADVSKKPDWERLLSDTLREFGQLDIVVNNAGIAYTNKATEDVTEDDFDLVFRVNVKSMFLSTIVLLPYFLKENRPGCFIQIASTGGVRPRPRLAWYNASKGALITATKSMAAEYGGRKLRFNAVSPSIGITPLTHVFLGKPETAENMAPLLESVPLGRPAEPADVANACCYLASDEASMITGVNLEVDGGRCV